MGGAIALLLAAETPSVLDRFQLAIVAHDEPAEIMKAFATMTGFPEMPPLWSHSAVILAALPIGSGPFTIAKLYGLEAGVTSGSMLKGVRRFGNGAETHSIVMRSKTGTVRWISAHHNFSIKTGLPSWA